MHGYAKCRQFDASDDDARALDAMAVVSAAARQYVPLRRAHFRYLRVFSRAASSYTHLLRTFVANRFFNARAEKTKD